MKKLIIVSGKALLSLLLVLLAIVILSEASPIYNFSIPGSFKGPDIYNPYYGLDTSTFWKRSNFHTHTRVDNILNECPEYPDVVYKDYMKLGYDVLAFSNHNLLTEHPISDSLQINVYEHGINLFKFHKLVFNPVRMILHDPLIPFSVSQKQFEYDYLGSNADFIVMNHPDRTIGMTRRSMQLLSGYRLIEADSGADTELKRWDEALDCGHYSFCLTSDDCHDSGNHSKVAIRCSWLDSDACDYDSVRDALLSGRFYSMRIPDFGVGDWNVKYSGNDNLPFVRNIGIQNDSIFIELSSKASYIKAIGQNHRTLDSLSFADSFNYHFKPEDSYVRIMACFDNGVFLYTNPFARFDRKESPTPYSVSDHSVNYILSLLFNLAVILLASLCIVFVFRLFSNKKDKS